MEPSAEEESGHQGCFVITATVIVGVMWWVVMFAAIGLGITHLNHCPVQHYIPIFLIVFGASNFLSLSLTYSKKTWKDGTVTVLMSAVTTLLHLFGFCWFITGNIWVYSVYPPSYTPGEARFCDRTTFLFAFVVLTVTWIILALAIVCGCCVSILACCNIFSMREQLTARRNRFYGSTSVDGRSAGDI